MASWKMAVFNPNQPQEMDSEPTSTGGNGCHVSTKDIQRLIWMIGVHLGGPEDISQGSLKHLLLVLWKMAVFNPNQPQEMDSEPTSTGGNGYI